MTNFFDRFRTRGVIASKAVPPMPQALRTYHQAGKPLVCELDGSPSRCDFWPADQAATYNAEYEVPLRAPGHFGFATNGDGGMFAIAPNGAVVSVPFIGMKPASATVVAQTWPAFEGMLRAAPKTYFVRDVSMLYDFIGYVVLTAPDRFPRREWLRDNEQMTLKMAFDELRHGVSLVKADFPDRPVDRELLPLLDQSYGLYRAGKKVEAALRLQDFSALIFKD